MEKQIHKTLVENTLTDILNNIFEIRLPQSHWL